MNESQPTPETPQPPQTLDAPTNPNAPTTAQDVVVPGDIENTQSLHTEQPIQQAAVPVAAAKTGNSKLPWILLVIVVLLLSAALYWLFMQKQSVNDSLTASKKDLQTAQASLSASNDKLASVQAADAKNAADVQKSVPTDNDLLMSTTTAYAQGKVGSENAKVTVAVAKTSLPFARTTVAVAGGSGYTCVLKKSNNIWLVIFCGQAAPIDDTFKVWGVPDNFMAS